MQTRLKCIIIPAVSSLTGQPKLCGSTQSIWFLFFQTVISTFIFSIIFLIRLFLSLFQYFLRFRSCLVLFQILFQFLCSFPNQFFCIYCYYLLLFSFVYLTCFDLCFCDLIKYKLRFQIFLDSMNFCFPKSSLKFVIFSSKSFVRL